MIDYCFLHLQQAPLLAIYQPWMISYLVMICFILCLLIVSPLTTLIHELGHAIPALLLTKKKVDVYVGSYGDIDRGITLKLSRLTIFFKYDVISWNRGLCHFHDKEIGLLKQFIIVLSGPLISLIFGFSICYLFFLNFEGGRILFLGFVILASSLIDFFVNLKPSDRGIKLNDGGITYNDGKLLIQLIKAGFLYTELSKADHFYNNKKYDKAGKLYVKAIEKGSRETMIFNIAISSLALAKEYDLAQKLIADFEQSIPKDTYTFTIIGFLHSKLGEAEKSMEMYNEAIRLSPKNPTALNNRGFQLIVKKEYEAAILDFNKAIELEENFAYPLCNRGHAKIELGLEEEGLKDILQSIELDNENSYAYRNLGIYYMRKKNRKKALENLGLALKLDPETFQIEELLLEAKEMD